MIFSIKTISNQRAKLGMSFVNKASMHQWCDLVFETVDGPTNQQESHTISNQASSTISMGLGKISMNSNDNVTLNVENLMRVILRCC